MRTLGTFCSGAAIWYLDGVAAKKPFWDKKNPSKKSKPLSDKQKSAAKARAKKAGRKYPNLVDNAWAAGRG